MGASSEAATTLASSSEESASVSVLSRNSGCIGGEAGSGGKRDATGGGAGRGDADSGGDGGGGEGAATKTDATTGGETSSIVCPSAAESWSVGVELIVAAAVCAVDAFRALIRAETCTLAAVIVSSMSDAETPLSCVARFSRKASWASESNELTLPLRVKAMVTIGWYVPPGLSGGGAVGGDGGE